MCGSAPLSAKTSLQISSRKWVKSCTGLKFRRRVSVLAQFSKRQSCGSGMRLELKASVLPQGQLDSVTVPSGLSGCQLPATAS
jgi:hypothetical protein